MAAQGEGSVERPVVKSAGRALAILDFVGERGVVRFIDLVTHLDLPRSSAHSLVQTLVNGGWLEHDPTTHQLALGLRVWQLGQRYAGHRDLATTAKPVMDALALEVGETVQLARLDGIENVYIAISEAPRPMRLASAVGMRLHAHGTGVGKVLLSQLDPTEAHSRLSAVTLPQLTAHTITDIDRLMIVLDDARRQGYAVDDEEYLVGCRCVAVPLPTSNGGGGDGLMAALSVMAPTFRCEAEWPERALQSLRKAAMEICTRLGRRVT